MDTHRLKYFLRIAEEGSITRAADALGIAQPALSRQIRLLEEDLGVAAGHVAVGLSLGGCVAEVAPAVDHLLGRAAADPELQPSARNEVRRARIFGGTVDFVLKNAPCRVMVAAAPRAA